MATSRGEDRRERLGTQASELIEAYFEQYLANRSAAVSVIETRRELPSDVATKLDIVINHRRRSYRDAVILQLAFGIVSGAEMDHCRRQGGGRSAAQRLGEFFAEHHIAGVADAFQNIGKNSSNLCRDNEPEFDQFLKWATSAGRASREAALRYSVASVSLTARPIAPMPLLDGAKLTFARVAKLFQTMLDTSSGGVHQQFIVAACLEAIIIEFDQGGPRGLRVETKRVNASDASAGVAGDIQIKRGNRTEEALEVTANPWSTKVAKASQLVRSEDLPRAHILASVSASDFPAIGEFEHGTIDLSVLDVDAFVRTMVAIMKKPARRTALYRLYELLDRIQQDIDRTNAYVKLLQDHELVEMPARGPNVLHRQE